VNDADVIRGTVAGIPLFAAETPPPYSAELVFRVGRADEIASTTGISHLVEHLALPAEVGEPVDYNGSVDNLFTRFSASGEPAEVHRFLERVTARLAELPAERIPTERRILLAEERHDRSTSLSTPSRSASEPSATG
jgi:predicted Zn-dependent peptidase